MSTCLLLKFYRKLKKLTGKSRIILVCHSIACKKSVYAKVLSAFFLKDLKCFKKLIFSHSVFGITGVIHDSVAHLKNSAGIISAGNCLWNLSKSFFQKFNVCEIVKIDDCTKLVGIDILFCRSIV